MITYYKHLALKKQSMTITNSRNTELTASLEISRVLNGMWQVAGGHGQIDAEDAINDMIRYHEAGLTTWDMADIYGPAEEYFGAFRKKLSGEKGEEELSKTRALTKFVPRIGPMTREFVENSVNRSLRRMKIESLDLVQFHWWDYDNPSYIDALYHLSNIRDDGKIKHIGLTNFDTKRLEIINEHGFNIVSNQVQFSIIDQRPEISMIPFCKKHDIKLLTYGTLLGGFLSEKYLDRAEPRMDELHTLSLQKYKNMIDVWGGWELFQELLQTLKSIAEKHDTTIANISTKFILDKPRVAGVIIGTRLGITNHINENLHAFNINLDKYDHSRIKEITSRSRDLMESIGDCGDEYR